MARTLIDFRVRMQIRKKINRLKKSSDGKTIVANFGYLTLLQFSSYLFPIITMPYLARVIGAEGFGKIAFAAAVMLWIRTIADWGFDYISTRDVAQIRENNIKVSQILSNTLWAKLVLSVFSGFILFIAVLCVPYLRENAGILAASFLLVPGYAIFPEWFFQAIEKMKYITILSLLTRIIFTLSVFLFIKEKEDYILQPILISIGYFINGIIAFYLILTKWGYKLYSPNKTEIISSIKRGTNVFANNIMPNFYNSLSVLLMGFWGGPIANGYYDGANRFVSIIVQVQTVLSRVFYPFLARRPEKHYIFAHINISFGFIGAVVLFIFAPFLVKIFLGPEFINSIIVIRILGLSIIFQAISNIYGTNYLIINHHEKDLRNITAIASVIGLVLAVVLVHEYTYVGAAIVLLVSRFLLGSMSAYKAIGYIKKNK